MDSELRAQREDLADALSMGYSADDYPGSKGWLATQAAQKALDDFDVTHPEIIAAIKAERAAKAEGKAQSLLSRHGGWYD